MNFIVLCIALAGALILIPLGLPGTWLMVAIAIIDRIVDHTSGIGIITIVAVAAVALIAELVELALIARYARRYGGSRRAGWGAVVGGFVGVIVGVPIPIIGSIIGGLVGSFVGALIAEYDLTGDHAAATRAATGALFGRAAAAAMKVGAGVAIAAWTLIAAAT
jgi:uncharacterized protein YqgC (DUF456 family)